MTQPTLFDDEPHPHRSYDGGCGDPLCSLCLEDFDKQHEPGAHRHEDPDTSVDAANSVDATALEAEVLAAFRDSPFCHHHGFTSEEAANYLRMELGSVTPRFRPLEAKGYIYRTTERRPGKSGRNRIVWKLVP